MIDNSLPKPEFRLRHTIDKSTERSQIYRDDKMGCECKMIFPRHGQKRKEYRIDRDPRVFTDTMEFLRALKEKLDGIKQQN